MKGKIGYWIATGLFSLMMVGSAIAYLTGAPQMISAFQHLGYPSYFRVLLGVAKILGVVALLLPFTPKVLREWAYAGFGFTLVSAAVSHAASGDAAGQVAGPGVALVLLIASYGLGRQGSPSPSVKHA